jgi:hypothetical protein
MVPYADFNLLKFPDKAQAMAKVRDLTCLSDILPTGFHGAACDLGVEWLDAALSKPQACPEARGVGVRMALSRGDYAALFGADVPHA